MRKSMLILPVLLGALGLLVPARAQTPEEKPAQKNANDYSNSSIVTRMMAFDKNKDGKLTRDEITDPRLLRLFDRADANKDGVVTREELMALAAQLDKEYSQGGRRGGPGGFGRGGPGGPGGPGGFGPGPMGPPPRPGQVLPDFLQDRLNLTPDQKKQVEDLQKEVDARLGKILTPEQKKQLQERPRGFGRGPGGPRGPGGGPPPDQGPPES